MRLRRDDRAATRNLLDRVSDRDLAARYWAARVELQRLRTPTLVLVESPSGEELAGAFLRIRELDALCAQLWRESQRRTLAGSIQADA